MKKIFLFFLLFWVGNVLAEGSYVYMIKGDEVTKVKIFDWVFNRMIPYGDGEVTCLNPGKHGFKFTFNGLCSKKIYGSLVTSVDDTESVSNFLIKNQDEIVIEGKVNKNGKEYSNLVLSEEEYIDFQKFSSNYPSSEQVSVISLFTGNTDIPEVSNNTFYCYYEQVIAECGEI